LNNDVPFRVRVALGLVGVLVVFLVASVGVIQAAGGVNWGVARALLIIAGVLAISGFIAIPVTEKVWSIVREQILGRQ
jgi:hypothetical protein